MKDNRYRIVGVLLIMLGGIILLDTLELFSVHWEHWLFSWKGLLLGVGLLRFSKDENWVPGTLMLLAAGFFIGTDLVEAELGFEVLNWNIFWPLFMVTGGLLVLIRTHTHQSA